MTELEVAYNLGVGDATKCIRFTAGQTPDRTALGCQALLILADTIDGLKIGDPEPPAPVDPASPDPAPLAPAAAAEAA